MVDNGWLMLDNVGQYWERWVVDSFNNPQTRSHLQQFHCSMGPPRSPEAARDWVPIVSGDIHGWVPIHGPTHTEQTQMKVPLSPTKTCSSYTRRFSLPGLLRHKYHFGRWFHTGTPVLIETLQWRNMKLRNDQANDANRKWVQHYLEICTSFLVLRAHPGQRTNRPNDQHIVCWFPLLATPSHINQDYPLLISLPLLTMLQHYRSFPFLINHESPIKHHWYWLLSTLWTTIKQQ